MTELTNREAPSGCERVRGRLMELWDGALPALEEARDHGHLEACASCFAEWCELEQVLASVVDSRALESELAFASEGLTARLESAHADHAPSPGQRSRISALLPLAACALALVAIRALSSDSTASPSPLSNSLHELGSLGASIAVWGEAVNDLLPVLELTEAKEG